MSDTASELRRRWHRPLRVRAQHADNQATMGVRLPTILAKAINDVYETLNQIVSAGEDWLT